MKHITDKIENIIYGYEPGIGDGKFLPIRIDGQVSNWDTFVMYKLRTVLRRG